MRSERIAHSTPPQREPEQQLGREFAVVVVAAAAVVVVDPAAWPLLGQRSTLAIRRNYCLSCLDTVADSSSAALVFLT